MCLVACTYNRAAHAPLLGQLRLTKRHTNPIISPQRLPNYNGPFFESERKRQYAPSVSRSLKLTVYCSSEHAIEDNNIQTPHHRKHGWWGIYICLLCNYFTTGYACVRMLEQTQNHPQLRNRFDGSAEIPAVEMLIKLCTQISTVWGAIAGVRRRRPNINWVLGFLTGPRTICGE